MIHGRGPFYFFSFLIGVLIPSRLVIFTCLLCSPNVCHSHMQPTIGPRLSRRPCKGREDVQNQEEDKETAAPEEAGTLAQSRGAGVADALS